MILEGFFVWLCLADNCKIEPPGDFGEFNAITSCFDIDSTGFNDEIGFARCVFKGFDRNIRAPFCLFTVEYDVPARHRCIHIDQRSGRLVDERYSGKVSLECSSN